MTKARMNTNPAKARFGVNHNRPNGAGAAADSLDEDQLVMAAINGNRATRRLAKRNLRKQIRSGA